MKKTLFIGLCIALVFAFSGCLESNENNTDENIEMKEENHDVEKPEVEEVEVDEIESEPEVVEVPAPEPTPEPEMKTTAYLEEAPQFLNYNSSDFKADLGNRPLALFFHATWCPVCTGIEDDINNSLTSLPKGTKIYQADFDTENSLKQQYGVTVQSTVIILDANGEFAEKLPAPSAQEIGDALAKLS